MSALCLVTSRNNVAYGWLRVSWVLIDIRLNPSSHNHHATLYSGPGTTMNMHTLESVYWDRIELKSIRYQ